VVISELAAFLGRRDYKQFADTMNPVLECEKVARQTLKLGHGQIDDLQLSELKAKGVEYNPAAGELSYVPNVCVLAATRPLDNRTFTYLNKSGHFSRYHVIQHEITDEEASEHLHKDFVMDQNALDSLRQINLKLSKIEVKELNRPSEDLLKEVYDSIEDIVKDEISNDPRRKLSDIITPRLKGDVIREFVANAFLRIASWNRYKDIAVLEYSEEDVSFVLGRIQHFVRFALEPLIVEDLTIRTFKRSKKGRAKATILELLGDGVESSRKEIVQYVRSRIDVSLAMIDIVLKELLTGKQIQHRFGHYKLEGGE